MGKGSSSAGWRVEGWGREARKEQELWAGGYGSPQSSAEITLPECDPPLPSLPGTGGGGFPGLQTCHFKTREVQAHREGLATHTATGH